MSNPDVLVLGGGIAGLTAATTLLRGGLNPLVLESSTRTGGAVRTHRENGFLAECGPNSLMLEDDGTEQIIRQLGLVPLEANPAAKKRFLVNRGKPVAAPVSAWGAVTTPLLSLPGKLRILLEPLSHSAGNTEESVAAFARRRLGEEAFRRLVDPMIAGVYAGDPEKLSLRHALPRLHLMEQRHGSLLLAGLRKGRAEPKRRIVNFDRGMESIPAAMATFLGAGRVQTGAELRSIEFTAEGWTVGWRSGDKNRRVRVRALVVTVPPRHWDALPWPTGLNRLLRPWQSIYSPPVSVISLGYSRQQVAHPLDGFGVLAPSCEKLRILGTLFPSSLFAQRAPADHVLLTSFVGGVRHPELTSLNGTDQILLVRQELAKLLGAQGDPVFTHLSRFPRAIPQYEIGYGRLAALLDEAERDCTGLHFCGNYRGGISVPKTILNAHRMAQRILEQLAC